MEKQNVCRTRTSPVFNTPRTPHLRLYVSVATDNRQEKEGHVWGVQRRTIVAETLKLAGRRAQEIRGVRMFLKSFQPLFWIALVICLACGCNAQLHFASLGNWGQGSSMQRTIAETLKATARREKISFVVSPGSNFISGAGIADISDALWTTHFRDNYRGPELFLPFFTVLGKDDWKGNFTALIDKSRLEYAALSNTTVLGPRWTIPNWWYHFSQHFQDASGAFFSSQRLRARRLRERRRCAFSGSNKTLGSAVDVSAGFIFVDTFILSDAFAYPNITKKHWDSLRDTVEAAVQIFDWTVVVGDVAMLSSGASKGNAILYRSFGSFLKDFGVDVYISGNDYDMEVIQVVCF